ncbi:MAG: DUF362 domain-containing protein [Candidatus Nanoarchaeia archaeon]|nr:DUF362 domain-containing protein [Candidatus Nanoarchaeia archaeon]
MGEVFIQGLSKDYSEKEFIESVEKILIKSSNNLKWLKKGDKVLLKPALNSNNEYPSTTDPLLLKAVSSILKKRGAKIIIADQSGIEHVVHTKGGVIKGSSEKCYEKSCMKQTDDEFIALEKTGWDKGFFNYSKNADSWSNGFYISSLINKVDHIINLPRISTHVQAGASLGFKNLVGLLREDSRVEFHNKGPFGFVINYFGKRRGIIKPNPKGMFFEKITEVSLAVKKKLRLTFFSGTKVQTTFGPDKCIVPIIGKAHKVIPNIGLIFASEDQVSAEAFALSYLTYLYKTHTPLTKKLLFKFAIALNGKIKELHKQNIWDNQVIKHALKIKLGTRNINLNYENTPLDLQEEIKKLL